MIEGDAGERQLTPEQELDEFIKGTELRSANLLAIRDVAREEELGMEAMTTLPNAHNPLERDSELKKLSTISAELGALRQTIAEREETHEGYGHARTSALAIFEKLHRKATKSEHTVDATFTAAKQILNRTDQITKRPPTAKQG